jgi:hypothetical protein
MAQKTEKQNKSGNYFQRKARTQQIVIAAFSVILILAWLLGLIVR